MLRTLLLASSLLLSACVPTYSHLPPLHPSELYNPLPYQHVQVDDMNLAYVDSGGDDPIILWVHGLSSYASFWEYQLTALPGYRHIALDLPGYGASDRPDAPYSMEWFADVVLGFMDAKGLDHVVLAGHSMGGQIAMTAALEHPERFHALILSAPAGFETYSRGHGDWLVDYWTERRALHSREEDIRRAIVPTTFLRRDDGVERLIEERVRVRHTPEFAGTSVAVARSVQGMIEGPVIERLGELELPTLVVFGRQDALIPNPIFNGGRTATVAKRGAEALPNAELVLIGRAGHTVHHDQPEAFNEAVASFLAQHR